MTKYNVLVSKTAIKQINSLNKETGRRIKKALKELEKDPFKSRSGADIKKLHKITKHQLYRLRVGNYRIAYTVENRSVKVAKIFSRGKGYNWLG